MIGAAKKESFLLPGLAALRLVLLLVVAFCLPETRVWGFAITPPPASGVFESANPLSIGEFTTVIAYDASGSPVAARAGGDGFTSMYRAVSTAELDDIAARGFQLKAGGYESKLFATSLDDAAAFGRDLYKLDGVPFHVVETRVPNSVFNQFERLTLDFKPAVNVPGSQLPGLNNSMIWSEVPAIPIR